MVFGLATDYFIKASVLDALNLGFKVYVIKDLCLGISEGSAMKARVEMKSSGAIFFEKSKFLASI